jgi:peroxiredoxin
MNRILTRALVLVLTLVLLIAGCSSSAPRVGKMAPDFRLPNIEGQAISLSDFQGKPVFLNFWATWCGPCRYEMPLIQAMFKESSDTGLVILAVDVGEDPSRVKDYLQSGNFSFPVLLDTNQNVALEYNVRGLPTTFLIDKDGIIQEVKVGAFLNMLEINKSVAKIIP